MKIEKILIVADDSPPSIRAVQYGFNLARDVGAKVILLSVIEPKLTTGNPDAGIFPDDALMAIEAKTNDFLNQLKETYGFGVETEVAVHSGDIMPAIIRAIADLAPSVVVAGTHGRTGLSKLFSGSVAESIIHHSKVPVLVVPPAK